jgi:hypothetical protein
MLPLQTVSFPITQQHMMEMVQQTNSSFHPCILTSRVRARARVCKKSILGIIILSKQLLLHIIRSYRIVVTCSNQLTGHLFV